MNCYRRLVILLLWTCLGWPLCASAEQEDAPFDPLRAAKAVEVGEYYMRRKNYDAAISRFEEAVYFKPNYALAYLRLGQAYEKALRPRDALRAYRKYVEILPTGKESDYVKRRIAEIENQLNKKGRGNPAHESGLRQSSSQDRGSS